MKIYSVLDPEFKAYGQVVIGMDEVVAEVLEGLKKGSSDRCCCVRPF